MCDLNQVVMKQKKCQYMFWKKGYVGLHNRRSVYSATVYTTHYSGPTVWQNEEYIEERHA